MPIYEYECNDCGHKLEAIQKFSDEPLTECPSCHADALQRLISAPSFRLKGGGWYETDFKTGNRRQLADDGRGKEGGKDQGQDQGKNQGGSAQDSEKTGAGGSTGSGEAGKQSAGGKNAKQESGTGSGTRSASSTTASAGKVGMKE